MFFMLKIDHFVNLKRFLVIFFINFGILGFCQNFDWTIGIAFDFGNKVKRIGLRSSANYRIDFFQVNSELKIYYQYSSLGVGKKTPEFQFGTGVNFGFGRQDSVINNFIGLAENNLNYNHSIGYAYSIYLDRQETSQTSGMVFINVKQFSFVTENDLLGAGKGWRDRYRTGAFRLGYRYIDTRISVSSLMWTGDYASCTKVIDSDYPARFGYRSNDQSVYGNFSLGLLSFQAEQVLPYKQTARVNVGVDSDRIRHALQNKALHDMPFYTDKMVKRQLMHIPMLQQDGSQYLFKEGQKVEKATFYYNLGLNPGVFY